MQAVDIAWHMKRMLRAPGQVIGATGLKASKHACMQKCEGDFCVWVHARQIYRWA